MSHWLKTNGFENADAVNNRGNERKEYLSKFLIHQLRLKNAEKKLDTKHEVTHSTTTGGQTRWLSREFMDKDIGEKGARWRASGLLETRPDRVTGSKEDDMIEYGCPEDWEAWANSQTHGATLSAATDADASDADMLNSSGAASSEIKNKPKTGDDILVERAGALCDDVRPSIRKSQDLDVDVKRLAEQANKHTIR